MSSILNSRPNSVEFTVSGFKSELSLVLGDPTVVRPRYPLLGRLKVWYNWYGSVSFPTSAILPRSLIRLKISWLGSINWFRIKDKLAELYKYDLFSSLNVEDQSFLADTSKYKKLS